MSLPYVDELVINVALDDDNIVVRNFIETSFNDDKVRFDYCKNDPNLGELTTFRRIVEFNDCVLLYTHFKGVTSKWTNLTEEEEKCWCDTLYDSVLGSGLEEIYKLKFGKFFGGLQSQEKHFINDCKNKLGTSYKKDSCCKFYSGSFYWLNKNHLIMNT